jgi:hypothetical protein
LGGEAAQGGGVVFEGGLGLDGGDAEVLIAVKEMGADRGDTGFGVAGDGGVAIENEVAMGRDGGGVDLGACKAGEEDRQDEGSVEEATGDFAGNRDAKSRRRKLQGAGDGHGGTSLLR